MNIFEQYGIKEVADVTIYAIELDKYDDEVYVPVMYLDTLKVSTLEQTADQTSARGGLGNAELITWDYGKEISVSLEDALYTPASQSLMWGGKFGVGKAKVRGLWNPRNYPKDEYGRTQYIEKLVASKSGNTWTDNKGNTYTEDQLINAGWQKFICPCDGEAKYSSYSIINADYKYEDITDFYELSYCPKNLPILDPDNHGEYVPSALNDQYDKIYRWNEYSGSQTDVKFKLTQRKKDCEDSGEIFKGAPEQAEIVAENFGDFIYKQYKLTEGSMSKEKFCALEEVDPCLQIKANSINGCGPNSNAESYIWEKMDLKMTSLEGEQDNYYLENGSLKYRIINENGQKEVFLAQEELHPTQYLSDEWLKQTGGPIVNGVLTSQETNGFSYGYFNAPFKSAIDFYINLQIPTSSEEEAGKIRILRVPVGTFYVITDWNNVDASVSDKIYPINSGLSDVKILERTEKCRASQTFCINTDKNVIMSNYFDLQKYAQSNLTVYIDPKTMKPYEPNADSFVRKNGDLIEGNLRIIKQNEIYYKRTRTIAPEHTSLGHQITVNAESFPGTYRIVGETYARSRTDGKDQRYQFEIPLAKLSPETNLTLQADGDPTTFNMNFRVLRKQDGTMMKLTQYNVDCDKFDGITSGSTTVIPMDGLLEQERVDMGTLDADQYQDISVMSLSLEDDIDISHAEENEVIENVEVTE